MNIVLSANEVLSVCQIFEMNERRISTKIEDLCTEYFDNNYCGKMPIGWYIDRLDTLRKELNKIKKENKHNTYLVFEVEEKMKKIYSRKAHARRKVMSGFYSVSFNHELKPKYKYN